MPQLSIVLTCSLFMLAATAVDSGARPNPDDASAASLRADLHTIVDALDRGAIAPELLAEIAADVRRAASRVQQTGGTREQCVDWAYEKLRQSRRSADAVTEAAAGCREVRDPRCPAFVYDVLRRSTSTANAASRAMQSCRGVRNVDDVQWMFEILRLNLSGSEAVIAASELARDLLPADAACLRRTYDVLRRTKMGVEAVNEAAKVCASARRR